MKIANILLSNKNGGVEQSFVGYCKILQMLGHQVIAIVKTGAPYIEDLEVLKVEVFEIDNNWGYYDFFTIKKIHKIIKNNNINLVFAHTGRAIVLAKKAIKKLSKKIPLIAVNHSNNVKRSIGADIILSVNKNIFYKTIDCGQKPDSSFFVPNFIDIIDEKTPEFNLENFTFSKDHLLVIGVVARLAKEKGLEYLIKAVKILVDNKYQVHLKIAGSGGEEKNLKALCNSLNLNKQVEFCGWIQNKKKFFSEIDIFCLPSLNETFGIVLLEAMLYNKPIITTKTDGAKTILKDGVSGILLDNSNLEILPELIANSVSKLLNNPEMVFDLTCNAKKNLINFYSLQAVLKCLKNIVNGTDMNQ